MRITASAVTRSLSISVGSVTASTTSRTLGGVVVRYGVHGRTSAGRLRVRPGALRFPENLTDVKLTREHERDNSRGHLVMVSDDPTQLRASLRVSDGPEGDDALREAKDRTRDGLSFDVVDATIEGDEITDALVIAIGQVGIPAYDDGRIDSIAAAATNPQERSDMTPEQIARLEALRALETLTQSEALELIELVAAEQNSDGETPPAEEETPPAATAAVAASATIPSGVPRPRRGAAAVTAGAARTQPRGLDVFIDTIVTALRPGGGGGEAITAALTDVTNTANPAVSAPGWSDELWSGVAYEPIFTPLLNSGPLTNWEGKGWRWVVKPAIADYAGDKAAIPSNVISTEPSAYEAARLAVGHDIDRKFYDFPDAGFLRSYVQAVGESTKMELDDKVEAFIVANAVAVAGAATTSLLKAAARVANRVTRARLGRATFIMVNEDDHENLMDVTEADVPAFLELFGISPNNFVPSASVAAGTVIGGVKNAATLRTLPGSSPIRVSAQHLANGGIDEAFFAYWAIEEHHPAAILKTTFA